MSNQDISSESEVDKSFQVTVSFLISKEPLDKSASSQQVHLTIQQGLSKRKVMLAHRTRQDPNTMNNTLQMSYQGFLSMNTTTSDTSKAHSNSTITQLHLSLITIMLYREVLFSHKLQWSFAWFSMLVINAWDVSTEIQSKLEKQQITYVSEAWSRPKDHSTKLTSTASGSS